VSLAFRSPTKAEGRIEENTQFARGLQRPGRGQEHKNGPSGSAGTDKQGRSPRPHNAASPWRQRRGRSRIALLHPQQTGCRPAQTLRLDNDPAKSAIAAREMSFSHEDPHIPEILSAKIARRLVTQRLRESGFAELLHFRICVSGNRASVVTNRLRAAGCRRRFRKLHEEQHLLPKATDRTMTALFTVILIALQLYTYVVIASAIFPGSMPLTSSIRETRSSA
jgi:hypothetical protein